jgi:hypothetical protein
MIGFLGSNGYRSPRRLMPRTLNECKKNARVGRDGALRRPRSVQRRNMRCDPHILQYLFSPLNAGWDGAARHPYQQHRGIWTLELKLYQGCPETLLMF